ncbi:SLOG domain-containing protein [Paraburkholderia sediminicola]|uniref:SLOG domain-containing protein n=1 Tax=Paraburkholderia sediminicola TaxID=458836 RepID=UPI0038B80649
MGSIFLSASVPMPGRAPFDQDCEPQMIQSAVSALATVALGRRTMVWGGHPAITPMLWASAKELGVQYAIAVSLFQTKLIPQEDFPEENKNFANVTYVDAVDGDRDRSLLAMREAMLKSAEFDAAVFIGGMEGVNDEHALFAALHPNAKCIPIGMTGGAARMLAAKLNYAVPADLGPLDFISLLYRELNISPLEQRKG